MSAGRALCLLLCFFLDVHVRADEVLNASAGKTSVSRENLKIVLAKGALVEIRAETFHLVRGQVLVESSSNTQFTTPFAKIWCDNGPACKALIERSPDHVNVLSLNGEWRFSRTGDKQIYRIPAAMQMRLGLVAGDGKAAMEFPQSLPWESTVKRWASLFQGKPDEFKAEVENFRGLWRQAIETASLEQQQGAERTLASHDEKLAKEASRRAADERESAELRRQLRERNFLTR
jgi:hypothetical protein